MNLPDLRIQFLLPNSTQKYQPIDLGIIANAKVSYQVILLRTTIDNTIWWNTGEHDFPLNYQHDRSGVNNGYFLAAADAMTMFKKAWSNLMPSTVLKCWS